MIVLLTEYKANQNAGILIFVSPIAPGILALWAQLNTFPAFDTSAKRLCHWIYRSVCQDLFHNSNYLQIKNVVNLSMLGIAVGLLFTQPGYLNNSVLVLSAISYFAAKPFAMIPNLFWNYSGRRLGPVKNKLRNSEFPSNSSSQPQEA